MKKPLEGVRVIELSTFVAAPVCGRMMADMGAEVIKVESPSGDGWRNTTVTYKPRIYHENHNPVFDLYNTGKKHISLNLKSQEGMAAMHKLLEKADVFITNTRPAALNRLGLGYEQLKKQYPGLIYAMILGYGEKGPDADLPAFDGTAFWARGGFLRDMPDADNYMPITPPGGIGDTFTGSMLLIQINAALYRRSRDGQGELVRSGLYHSAVFGMGTMNLIAQDPDPTVYPRARKQQTAFTGTFGCSDGEWIYFAPGTVKEIEKKVAKMVGLDFLLDDPRFATVETRQAHNEELYPLFRDAFLKKSSDHWLEKLHEMDIAGVLLTHFKDVYQDEQAWANDYLEHITFPDGTDGVIPTSPLEMESMGKVSYKPAHKVGQDTVEILQGLGYTEAQINHMLASGAVSDKRKI